MPIASLPAVTVQDRVEFTWQFVEGALAGNNFYWTMKSITGHGHFLTLVYLGTLLSAWITWVYNGELNPISDKPPQINKFRTLARKTTLAFKLTIYLKRERADRLRSFKSRQLYRVPLRMTGRWAAQLSSQPLFSPLQRKRFEPSSASNYIPSHLG